MNLMNELDRTGDLLAKVEGILRMTLQARAADGDIDTALALNGALELLIEAQTSVEAVREANETANAEAAE